MGAGGDSTQSSSSTGEAGGMAGSAGMGGGGASTAECEQATDCPGMDTSCQSRTCNEGHCGVVYAPSGTLADEQIAGDCQRRVCDGTGNIIALPDDLDFLDDQSDCTLDACNAGALQHTPLAAGTACASNGGQVCNDDGVCVECISSLNCGSDVCQQNKCAPASCIDGIQNGSETDVDCGGIDCTPCVDGKACASNGDCTSNVCVADACVTLTCMDGAKNGSDTDIDCGGDCPPCADGLGCNIGLDCASGVCTENICQPSACADGIVNGAESCDDGNLDSADGCDATCVVESGFKCMGSPSFCLVAVTETEPQGWCQEANGPWTPPFIYSGQINPAQEEDRFIFSVPALADVKIELEAIGGADVCSQESYPNRLELLKVMGMYCAYSAAKDSFPGSCANIDPSVFSEARGLAPGQYVVSVSYGVERSYEVRVEFTALCGNGIREGTEECDGFPNCDATCQRIPICGDRIWDAPEQCDDGNLTDGDCCSSTCQVEMGAACPAVNIEPNETCAQANGPFSLPAVVDTPLMYTGAISAFNDVDFVAFTVPNYADVKLETFDPIVGQCANADTVVTLLDASCNPLASDDDDGLVSCSKIAASSDTGARHLAPGTYYATVKHYNGGLVPRYELAISMTALCGNGLVEGSEVCDGQPGCSADCSAL